MADGKTPIYDLLAEAQKDMSNPKMNGEGQIGSRRYKYAELADVLKVVRTALNEHGLYLLQKTSRDESGAMYISTCVCRGDEVVELDREFYEYESDPQNFGKRETYARRYSLNKAFGLAGEDDNDAANVGKTSKVAQVPKRQQPNQADKRKKMLARCAELATKCIENGMNAGATEAYMVAKFNVKDMSDLTDEQLIEYGKYLHDMERQSADMKAGKEQGNVD